MTKTLEEQIEERQQEAEKKQLYEKAKLVVEKLGKFDRCEDWYHDSEVNVSVHTFNDAVTSLVVNASTVERSVDYSWVGVDISFNGKKVFSARDDYVEAIDSYIPGDDWEKKLDTLYLAAQQIVAKEQAEATRKAAAEKAAAEKEAAGRKRASEDAKRAQWGFDSEEPHDIAVARQRELKKWRGLQ